MTDPTLAAALAQLPVQMLDDDGDGYGGVEYVSLRSVLAIVDAAALASAPAPAGGLDAERLTAFLVAASVHAGLHEDFASVRAEAEWIAAEWNNPRSLSNLRLAATEPDARSASGPSASDALGAAPPAEDPLRADFAAKGVDLDEYRRAIGREAAPPAEDRLAAALEWVELEIMEFAEPTGTEDPTFWRGKEAGLRLAAGVVRSRRAALADADRGAAHRDREGRASERADRAVHERGR